jgi:hypothetical protein
MALRFPLFPGNPTLGVAESLRHRRMKSGSPDEIRLYARQQVVENYRQIGE